MSLMNKSVNSCIRCKRTSGTFGNRFFSGINCPLSNRTKAVLQQHHYGLRKAMPKCRTQSVAVAAGESKIGGTTVSLRFFAAAAGRGYKRRAGSQKQVKEYIKELTGKDDLNDSNSIEALADETREFIYLFGSIPFVVVCTFAFFNFEFCKDVWNDMMYQLFPPSSEPKPDLNNQNNTPTKSNNPSK